MIGWPPEDRLGHASKCLIVGGRTRARTWDPLIKSQLLYQLSYAPAPTAAPLGQRASSSKRGQQSPANRVPKDNCGFARLSSSARQRRLGIRASCRASRSTSFSGASRKSSNRVRSIIATVAHAGLIHAAALKLAGPVRTRTAGTDASGAHRDRHRHRPQDARQDGEAAFLGVVEAA